MDDVTEFPALAQAKRLFLRRKYAARQHETGLHQQIKLPQGDENMSSKNPRSAQTNQQKQTRIDSDFGSRYSTTLESIFSDVDQHLQFISSNLVQINTMVRQEYYRESLALDKLTNELLEGKAVVTTAHLSIRRHRTRSRMKKPRIKLQTIRQSSSRSSASKSLPSSEIRQIQLAHQVVKASVLQSYTRMYLYHHLYRGGPTQLHAARKLAIRSRQLHIFHLWRRAITFRNKLRLRCCRAQKRIAISMTSWARSRAMKIVEVEGKYAMAKMYHQAKVVGTSFQIWLSWYSNISSKIFA